MLPDFTKKDKIMSDTEKNSSHQGYDVHPSIRREINSINDQAISKASDLIVEQHEELSINNESQEIEAQESQEDVNSDNKKPQDSSSDDNFRALREKTYAIKAENKRIQ